LSFNLLIQESALHTTTNLQDHPTSVVMQHSALGLLELELLLIIVRKNLSMTITHPKPAARSLLEATLMHHQTLIADLDKQQEAQLDPQQRAHTHPIWPTRPILV